ncbi:glycosyl hydrolase family 18 protein [Priestia koreensis]|uniref:glycosyl hydrolase family 18 protein n=1 Tax=Priestia koreensis TaxID=284581 RepID=UPI003458693E
MFVYKVRSGDTLFAISAKFSCPMDQIRMVNGLTTINIVPGQALLIPLYTYTVQPGDTWSGIVRSTYVSKKQLQKANPSINPSLLYVGTKIKIPSISNYLAATMSYYGIRNEEADRTLIADFAPYSSAIAMFEYHFAPNGDIVNQLNDRVAIETSWKNRVVPLVTVTNLNDSGFSGDLAHEVLNNPVARTNLVNNIFTLVNSRGYGGVNIDFEQVRGEDRDLFTGFLEQVRKKLNASKYVMTIAVPAKTSEDIPWLQGYDYGGIGDVVNYMFIMAYDWHYGGSEPGAVAPIEEVRKTIEFAIDRVERKKLIIGMPLYGYDWALPYEQEAPASAVSNQNALLRAMHNQARIRYSKEAQAPYFRYTDKDGKRHEVWFEDVRSISEKAKLVREYNLQSIGVWQLTLGFTAGPWILRKFFTVRKV